MVITTLIRDCGEADGAEMNQRKMVAHLGRYNITSEIGLGALVLKLPVRKSVIVRRSTTDAERSHYVGIALMRRVASCALYRCCLWWLVYVLRILGSVLDVVSVNICVGLSIGCSHSHRKQRRQKEVRGLDREIEDYSLTGPLGATHAVGPSDEVELLTFRLTLIVISFSLLLGIRRSLRYYLHGTYANLSRWIRTLFCSLPSFCYQ